MAVESETGTAVSEEVQEEEVVEGGAGEGEATEEVEAAEVEEKAPSSDDKADRAWLSQLPEDIRGEKSLQQVKSVDALAKGYVDAQKYIGGAVKLPGPDATDDEVRRFRTKLGVPESSAGYEIHRPDMPDNVPWAKSDASAYAGFAHSIGLTPHQAQSCLNYYGGRVTHNVQQTKAVAQESLQSLREEWGAATDRKIATAQAAVRSLGNEEVAELLDASGVGNHPDVVRLFSKVGELLQEDGVLSEVTHHGLTADDAQKELSEIMADGAYVDDSSPKHDALVARATKLHEMLYN